MSGNSYFTGTDDFFVRIWNSGTGQWDETLEKQVEEREIIEWRREMEEKEEAAGIDQAKIIL
ncbi:hypothetical protein BB776_04535 [Planococcus salinarum]|uniref:Uncharacterized protein n=1 Tax=Planococcus salinarum TaxID=622695 RepID=A0ABX3CVJ5_9BACL|nr:hypothetical protein [Planococcus salinarum]OHX48954.1 hypothetical protein BB776_04535 [Planococcus salinarum]TAA73095.1 hypothetical protein D2909_03395 [Planococcus salinarum]